MKYYALLQGVILNDLSDLDWLGEIVDDMKHGAVSLRQLSYMVMVSVRRLRETDGRQCIMTVHVRQQRNNWHLYV